MGGMVCRFCYAPICGWVSGVKKRILPLRNYCMAFREGFWIFGHEFKFLAKIFTLGLQTRSKEHFIEETMSKSMEASTKLSQIEKK